MSRINCADCPWRKRENSFNTHKFRDECHHPKAAFTRGVAHPEIGRGRAVTPDHSGPPVNKEHPRWCPRALALKEGQSK